MNSIEKQLAQIAQIRELRVNNVRRKQMKLVAEEARMRGEIQEAEQNYRQAEIDYSTTQREQLQRLVTGGTVSPHLISAYTKSALEGVGRIKEAFGQIDHSKSKFKETRKKVKDVAAELTRVEKKLIGLEEVIEHQLWRT
jgi:hypothetical protein